MIPDPQSLAVTGARRFRFYAALVFSFAWVPVMYTAFHLERGFSAGQYARLWSVYYASMVVAELPWGWVADRFGQRPLLIAGPLVLGASFLVLGHGGSFAVCLGAMAVTGAAHAMISGADSAWLYELLMVTRRRAEALQQESIAHRWRLLGVSAADLAGGFVAFTLGTAAAFDFAAALMLLAAAAAWSLPRLPRTPLPPRAGTSVGRLIADLRRPGVLWSFAWYAGVFVLLRVGFQLYQPTLIDHAVDDLRLHGATFAGLNLVAGLAALSVTRVYARFGERGSALAVLLMLLAAFAGLALLGPLALLPLLALQQVSFAYLQPVGRTALNHRIPSRDRASLLSAQSVAGRLAFAGVLFAVDGDRAVADLTGTYTVLAVAAAALALLLFVRAPAPPAPVAGD